MNDDKKHAEIIAAVREGKAADRETKVVRAGRVMQDLMLGYQPKRRDAIWFAATFLQWMESGSNRDLIGDYLGLSKRASKRTVQRIWSEHNPSLAKTATTVLGWSHTVRMHSTEENDDRT